MIQTKHWVPNKTKQNTKSSRSTKPILSDIDVTEPKEKPVTNRVCPTTYSSCMITPTTHK